MLPLCTDVDLHFWDAPDDIHGARMDLLFERDRVYLHKATGHFGAIPLSVSGVRTHSLLNNGQWPAMHAHMSAALPCMHMHA